MGDDQLAEIMQQLTLEQQKRSQKTGRSAYYTNPGPAHRSSRSRSPKPKTKSHEHGSLVMHQGRGGSVCEHFFAKLHYINPYLTMDQAREGASRITSTAGAYQHVFVLVKKINSGTAVGDIGTTAAQVLSPMESKKA